MLDTNLLPPKEREALWFEEQQRLVIFFLILLAGVFLVGFVLMVPSYALIIGEGSGLQERLLFEKELSDKMGVKDSLKRIEGVDEEISLAARALVRPVKTSVFVGNFLGDAGSAIQIKFFTYTKAGAIILNGRAATRRDLLAFEKKLRESGQFQALSFPLSSIVRDRDIDFSIQATLKPNQL